MSGENNIQIENIQVEEVETESRRRWNSINDVISHYSISEVKRFLEGNWSVLVGYNNERTFIVKYRETSKGRLFIRSFLAIEHNALDDLVEALQKVQEIIKEQEIQQLIEVIKKNPKLMEKLKKYLH